MRRARTPTTAVTGAAAGLGGALLERFAVAADPQLGRLVGLDVVDRPDTLAATSVQWRRADVRDAVLARRLADVTTVVHLAMSYDPAAEPEQRRALNVRGTAALLEAARVAGVQRVVLVTGVDVYGAPVGTPQPLGEDAPLAAAADDSLTGELVEVERLADHAARTGVQVVVLRAAALVAGSLGAAYDGALLHPLGGRRLLAVRGVEPLWQLCHVQDLLAALQLAARGDLRGPAVVACDGWLTQREVEQRAGLRRLELPAAVAVSTAERLHRTGLTVGSPHELDRLLRPLVLSTGRLHAAGWSPAWSNAQALDAHLAARSDDHPAAARAGAYAAAGYTAAGATAALLGTAAVVRQRRRRAR